VLVGVVNYCDFVFDIWMLKLVLLWVIVMISVELGMLCLVFSVSL